MKKFLKELSFHFRYSAPSEEDIRNANYHSSGLISQEFLSEFISPETHIYFCGPKPMMQHTHKALAALGHPEPQTHFEFFGPQTELES